MIEKEKKPSYRTVNYLLRLKKQIERKIIVDILKKLDKHATINIEEYVYFGLGSIYFADFSLFHRFLGIKEMISLELPPGAIQDQSQPRRFFFNRPYKFIELEFMFSTELLKRKKYKKFDWEKPLLIWLDYDDPLEVNSVKYIAKDIELIGQNAKEYDVFMTTVECWKRASVIEDAIESEKISKYFKYNYSKPESLQPENSPKILNDFIWGALEEGFRNRTSPMDFLQIFYFDYKDTTPMYTFGCIFISPKKIQEFKDIYSNSNHGIDFYDRNSDPLKIDCPIITPKEKYWLDSCIEKILDNDVHCDMDKATYTGLEVEEIEIYNKYYKDYPQFFEAIY